VVWRDLADAKPVNSQAIRVFLVTLPPKGVGRKSFYRNNLRQVGAPRFELGTSCSQTNYFRPPKAWNSSVFRPFYHRIWGLQSFSFVCSFSRVFAVVATVARRKSGSYRISRACVAAEAMTAGIGVARQPYLFAS